MKKIICAATAALGLSLALAGHANAGIYTDDMSKCLVKATTPADRTDLMTWVFSAMTSHPAISSMSNVTPAQRDAHDKRAAELFTRLLTVDCRSQTVDAIKYEGAGAIQQSFSVLGQVAMAGLMGDPTVTANIANLAKHFDEDKFKALMTDAGQPQAPAKK